MAPSARTRTRPCPARTPTFAPSSPRPSRRSTSTGSASRPGLFASGDGDPYDGTDEGFDAIFENPIFAGADTSYWIRQTIPFARRRPRVQLNGRNGVLPALRSSKEQGQSNFANPGTMLLGAGADFDILPELRLSCNVNHLRFNETAGAGGAAPAGRRSDTTSAGTCRRRSIWRPSITQNVVFRLSGATLLAGNGFATLFATDDDFFYSGPVNLVLTY